MFEIRLRRRADGRVLISAIWLEVHSAAVPRRPLMTTFTGATTSRVGLLEGLGNIIAR